ncbi:MAG: hypothetical protein KC609_25495 [Myxococcales bacterium]|nr:hypothetical protein [Myxococcales bacterium]
MRHTFAWLVLALVISSSAGCARKTHSDAEALARQIGLSLCSANQYQSLKRLQWMRLIASNDLRNLPATTSSLKIGQKAPACRVELAGVKRRGDNRYYLIDVHYHTLAWIAGRRQWQAATDRELIHLREFNHRWFRVHDGRQP